MDDALIRKLRRSRWWLIITGVPLAGAAIGLGSIYSFWGMLLGAMGAFVAIKTADLLKHDPLLDR